MSKIYTHYLKLKEKDSNKFYLFKNGIFYILVGNDAENISKVLNLKLTNLNEDVVKCGFPASRLNIYLEKFKDNNIMFEIIDPNYSKIENTTDYMNNENLKEIVLSVTNIDFNNITYKQSFDFLQNLKNKLLAIYNKGE